MNNTFARRNAILATTVLGMIATAQSAVAGPSQRALDVLLDRAALQNLTLPAHARAASAISGTLNPGVLSAPELELRLADGRKINATLKRVAGNTMKGTRSWVGEFDDAPGSILVLSQARGVTTGFANYGDLTIEIAPTVGGKHVLFIVDNARLPQGEVVDRVHDAADTATDNGYGLGGASAQAADAVVHDLMVVYTAASAARYGAAVLESNIQAAVEAANQAYINSQVGITLNLVSTGQVDVAEGSSMSATKTTLQSSSAVANLRNQVGADIVMLVSENSDYCGLASLMTSNSTSFASSAYGVVYSACLSNQSLAHEVGHNQGLMHDRDSSSYGGVYPYSYGYRRCVSDGTGFRDIMSYSCSGAPRVLVFSNPYVSWNGYPAGVSYEASPSTSAENARTLINTAATVAAFRSSTSSTTPETVPSAPSGLAVQSAAHDRVTVRWTDNSSNETGFKVERSPNGATFTEVATLGAGMTSFADGAVLANTLYFYRVRAYNSAGASGYSGTVSVTTPDLPPPPPSAPTSISATDNGDGTALASWTASSSAASTFEVQREQWNARKNSWGRLTVAATVPGNVFSIVDASGAGTYRYFVRALNDSGASSAAGPAEVIVTATASSSTPIKGKGRSGK